MPHLGPLELVIILVIVIIVFGVGKLPQIGGAIGQSIKEFRDSSRSPDKDEDEQDATPSKRASARSARLKREEDIIEEEEEEEEEEERA